MSRPIALLDCDGVLADFIGALLHVVREVTGRSHAAAEVTRLDFAASLGLSASEGAAVRRWLGASRGWCEALDPCPGAIDGVHALREIADVYVVTSPWNSCPTWTHERETWLKRHFDIPHASVLHGSAKWLVRGDAFVDDKTEAVQRWEAAHPRGVAVRWVTPHNRLDGPVTLETGDWAELRALVAAQPERT